MQKGLRIEIEARNKERDDAAPNGFVCRARNCTKIRNMVDGLFTCSSTHTHRLLHFSHCFSVYCWL